jgi:hypothetical protein
MIKFTTSAAGHEDIWNGGTAPRIPNLGTALLQHPFDSRLGDPESQSGRNGEEKTQPLSGIEQRTSSHKPFYWTTYNISHNKPASFLSSTSFAPTCAHGPPRACFISELTWSNEYFSRYSPQIIHSKAFRKTTQHNTNNHPYLEQDYNAPSQRTLNHAATQRFTTRPSTTELLYHRRIERMEMQ